MGEPTNETYLEISKLDGTRYAILACNPDGEGWSPQVDRIDEHGEPVENVVDAETTDELYEDAKTCLLHGLAYVV